MVEINGGVTMETTTKQVKIVLSQRTLWDWVSQFCPILASFNYFWSLSCLGSLITSTYFISAAHCNNILITGDKDRVSQWARKTSPLFRLKNTGRNVWRLQRRTENIRWAFTLVSSYLFCPDCGPDARRNEIHTEVSAIEKNQSFWNRCRSTGQSFSGGEQSKNQKDQPRRGDCWYQTAHPPCWHIQVNTWFEILTRFLQGRRNLWQVRRPWHHAPWIEATTRWVYNGLPSQVNQHPKHPKFCLSPSFDDLREHTPRDDTILAGYGLFRR